MAEWKYCLLFLLLLGIAAGPAVAHPPSGVTLVYSEQNGEVAMTVNHSVSDPSVGTRDAALRSPGEDGGRGVPEGVLQNPGLHDGGTGGGGRDSGRDTDTVWEYVR
ncbi:MAG TPA: hypothetical protein PLE57_00345, partial [Methanoregulaceae archaeon]|nr:hypothetical protein [Methanoregulaceae archaeon]